MAETGAEAVAGERLRAFVGRIDRLEADKAAVASDIRDVYAEAKAAGFEIKVLRQIVRLRGMDQAERAEQEELLALYRRGLGMDG